MVRLGGLKVKNPYLFAPIDAYSDSAFRRLCSDYGASYSFTQLVHTAGFIRKPVSLKKKLDLKVEGGIQFISNSPDELKEAVRLVNEKEFYEGIENVKSIDLNLGCPSQKMRRLNLGSALLSQPKLVKELFRVMRKFSVLPVSAKMRLNDGSAVEIAKLAEKELDFITIHGRSAEQAYSGSVNLDAMRDVCGSVSIPVVGNGSVVDVESADRMLEFCSAVMVGRHALREPFIFRQLSRRSWRCDYEKEKRRCISEYLRYAMLYEVDFKYVKLHLQLLLKGLDKELMTGLARAKNMDCINRIMQCL
jgi:tRNA-dihydrouridine synthase